MNNLKLKCKTYAKCRAPFAWVGGKSRLAKDIIALMPEHKTYAEVFGGALSVFYQKAPSKLEIINDINSDLINLHRIIKSRPISLQIELNNMLRSREIFELIKNKAIKPRNNVQKAAFYYYLISLSFGAKMDNFAMSKSLRSPKNIYKSFEIYSKRLKMAVIENLSYEKFIKEYDGVDTLFYLDPPYIGTENYYKMPRAFDLKSHENLAFILKGVRAKFILSYNDCPVVRELYKDFNIKEVSTNYSLNINSINKKAKELIIMNY
ncbi:DNA adenine methylase [Campylobacter ureolyticus]|uniref:Modification methylase DpnIIA n=2 Tax=Campylobacter ureolyticus TaxID=827 RepID=A0A6N2SCK3_9BACT